MRGPRKPESLWLVTLLLFGLTGCGRGVPPADEEHEHSGIAVTVRTDQTELFFEYRPMVAGAPGESWAIHVTRLSDFKPVTEGSLSLYLQKQDGQGHPFISEAPTRPGIFLPAPSLPEPGVYRVIMEVHSPPLTDRIDAGEITVYASEAEIPHEEEDDAGGGISFLKEQQWPIDFSVVAVERRELVTSVQVSGEVLPVPRKMAEVAAPIDGLVLAEANLSASVSGERVKMGQILATLSPTGGDDSFAETKALVERLVREVERASRLYDAEAIPEKRLVEARAQLAVAQSRLDAMGSAEDGYHYFVRAPISGIVAKRELSSGSRVAAGDHLFTIIDASEVWVRLRVPSRYAEQASKEHVAAPIDGLVLAEANLSASVSGERVKMGQILATLSPTGGDDSFAETKALVERLVREVERASRLYDAEAIPEKRLVEARAQLAVAQSRLDAMGSAEDGYHYFVRAPISGIVAKRELSSGSRVAAGDHLFTIIDASEVWVRLRVPSRYAEQASKATGALFTVEGSTRRYRADRIQSIGSMIDPDSRTLPVTAVVKNPDASLKIGMFAQAYLHIGGSRAGVTIPNKAIQNEDAVPVAYVQVGGETFERRVLRLGPTDGEYTIVAEGVEEHDHVVTLGAYQVYLSSLSTSDIATEGHAH